MAEPDPVDATDPWPAGLRVVVTLVAAALPVLGGIWVMDIPAMLGFVVFTEQTLAVMLGLAIALVFLNAPADRGPRHWLPWYDAVAAAVGSCPRSWGPPQTADPSAPPRPFVADEPDITYGRALNEIRVGDDDTGRSHPQPGGY